MLFNKINCEMCEEAKKNIEVIQILQLLKEKKIEEKMDMRKLERLFYYVGNVLYECDKEETQSLLN